MDLTRITFFFDLSRFIYLFMFLFIHFRIACDAIGLDCPRCESNEMGKFYFRSRVDKGPARRLRHASSVSVLRESGTRSLWSALGVLHTDLAFYDISVRVMP